MPSPAPYILLFILIMVVALACLLKFSSLRNYRRKRTLLVYGVVALLLSLTAYQAGYIGYEASMGAPMMVTYDIEYHRTQLYAGQNSEFTITCENLGRRETSFYLVLNSENASLLANNQRYSQVNSTSIKIPFTLHTLHEKADATVYFRIDENVTGSKFAPSIERMTASPIATGSTAAVECFLNPKTNSYNFTAMPGPCV